MEEGVSFIVPVRNGEFRLPHLLQSIRFQRYPQELVDIVIVDDASTDNTEAVSQSFGARIVRHSSADCERGKAIGLEAALHDIVVFVDDDNVLVGDDWIRIAMNAMRDSTCVAAQPARFQYDRSDSPANRYQSIFGGTDPIVSYLGRRDRLSCWASGWDLAGEVLDESRNEWTVRFRPSDVPTLGAQGFISRKSMLQRTECAPLYFHIDVCAALIAMGFDRFVMFKRPIVHNHCQSFRQMLRKMQRNFRRFLRDKRVRTYRYDVAWPKKVRAGLLVSTGVAPAITGMRAFVATRDPVSLMHPVVCMVTTLLYAYESLSYLAERVQARASRKRQLVQE